MAVAALVFTLCAGTSCDRKSAGGKAVSPSVTIETLLSEGDAAFAAAHFEDALIPYEKALALTNKNGDPKRWADIAARAARVHEFMGDWTGAGILLTKVVWMTEEQYGREAPESVQVRSALARVRREASHQPEAEALIRSALSKDEASCGKDSREVAMDLKDLAELLQTTNRPGEAEPLIRRALAIDEATFGKNSLEVCSDLQILTDLLINTSRLEDAKPLRLRQHMIMGDTEAEARDKIDRIVAPRATK